MTAKESLRKCERIMGNSFDGLYPTDEIKKIVQPIEQALTELDELKRDVARYFELEGQDTFNSQEEHDEYYVLYDKLSKVGK